MSNTGGFGVLHPAVRLVHPTDLKRLATIEVAAFAKEDLFSWLHPNFDGDIRLHIAANLDDLKDSIQVENNIITVIEAPYRLDECDKLDLDISYDGVAPSNILQEGNSVIVGFAIWTWYPQDSRNLIRRTTPGRETTTADHDHLVKSRLFPPANGPHYEAYSGLIKTLYFENLNDCDVILQKLAIHPAYQRQGYGSALVNWGMHHARNAGLDIAVDVTGNGAALYRSLQFETVKAWRLEGDEESPKGLSGEMMMWKKEDVPEGQEA